MKKQKRLKISIFNVLVGINLLIESKYNSFKWSTNLVSLNKVKNVNRDYKNKYL